MKAVIVPVFGYDAFVLNEIVTALERYFDIVVVVDDGSVPPVYAEMLEYDSIHLIQHSHNLGKGAALKSGIRYILGLGENVELIATMDADGQHRVVDCVALSKEFERIVENAGSVPTMGIGSRMFRLTGTPMINFLGNKVINSIIQVLYNSHIEDSQSGLRVFNAKLATAFVELEENGFDFEMSALICALSLNSEFFMVRVPAIYTYESSRLSAFRKIRDSWAILVILLSRRFF